MRLVRSTILRLLNAREARIVLGSSPRARVNLSLSQLRDRADQARALHEQYSELAERHLAAARSRTGDMITEAQLARDMAARCALFAEAASRYDRAIQREEALLRPSPRAPTIHGVTVFSVTGERVAPGVTAGREIRVRKEDPDWPPPSRRRG